MFMNAPAQISLCARDARGPETVWTVQLGHSLLCYFWDEF